MNYAATGHHPDKILPGTYILENSHSTAQPTEITGYHPLVREWLLQYATRVLKETLEEPAELQPSLVYTGMALGWDQAVAEACCELHIPFEAAIPFHGFESGWQWPQRNHYYHLLKKASKVHIICEGGFAAWKMKRRNIWMVDKSRVLLSLWNGSHGGTQHTVHYAKTRTGYLTISLWEEWRKFRDEQLRLAGYVRQQTEIVS